MAEASSEATLTVFFAHPGGELAVREASLQSPDAREEVAGHDHLSDEEKELEGLVVDGHAHFASLEDAGGAHEALRGWGGGVVAAVWGVAWVAV